MRSLRALVLGALLSAAAAAAPPDAGVQRLFLEVRSTGGPVGEFQAFGRRFSAPVVDLTVPAAERYLGTEVRAEGFFDEFRVLDGGSAGVVWLEPARVVEFELQVPPGASPFDERRRCTLTPLGRFELRSSPLAFKLPMAATQVRLTSPWFLDQVLEVPAGVTRVQVALQLGNQLRLQLQGVKNAEYGHGAGTVVSVRCDDQSETELPRLAPGADGPVVLTGLPDGRCVISAQVHGQKAVAAEVSLPSSQTLSLDARSPR